jgi:hypothetical protein
MGAIIIKLSDKNKRLISSLAKELGGNVLSISEDQYEDFALGVAMDKVKRNENVGRKDIYRQFPK